MLHTANDVANMVLPGIVTVPIPLINSRLKLLLYGIHPLRSDKLPFSVDFKLYIANNLIKFYLFHSKRRCEISGYTITYIDIDNNTIKTFDIPQPTFSIVDGELFVSY